VTDAEGRYEIGDLPSGRYTVTASKSTYVTITYGQTRPLEPGRPLEIGDKQIVEKVDFVLPKGGVIAGRVVDEYGEPVANAMVQPMQNRFMGGQQRPMMSGQPFTTSDTGEYRLWGLSPGQYFVSVNPRGMGGFMDNSDDRAGYAATYYPGTGNVAEAQSITVADGQTASGVDIMLVATRTARVSGTAIDASGQPVRMGMVMAMQRSTTGIISPQGGQIRADGTFVISGLTPGEYTLRANVPQTLPGGGPPEPLIANVTVAGADITDVVLSPVQPAVVRGRIVFDPPTTSLQPSMLQVMSRPRNPEPLFMSIGVTRPPTINDDFTFELQAPAGRMVIGAVSRVPQASGSPWVVKSVRHGSTDITDAGLDLAAGDRFDDVEIVLTNRVQAVSGLITNAQGQMVTDATVMIFAQDREEWGAVSRYQTTARPDQNGRYSARTLPPGEYYAVAVQYVDPARRGGDPTYYEQFVPDAVGFTLREAESRALDLKLVVPR
jgi:protocatechuate 3,4-dioxygenase beta subunit